MPQESVAYFFRRLFSPNDANSEPGKIRSIIPFKIRYDLVLLSLLVLFPLILFSLMPAIPQPQSYHDFADKRPYMGIPHFFNVFSNFGFLWAGYRGIQMLRSNGLTSMPTRSVYQKFFAFVFLGGIGSAIYNVYPNDLTLFLDRFPMMLAVMALFSAIVAERVSPKLGFASLYPLLGFGALATLYWAATEICNVGDLRAYGFAQFMPIILVPYILMKSRSQMVENNRHLWKMVVYVTAARFSEWMDWMVYQLSLHLVSGHMLKHVFVFLAILEVMLHVQAQNTSMIEEQKSTEEEEEIEEKKEE